MQPVGGVADQHAARGRQAQRLAQNQRVRGALADARERAEPVTELALQFLEKRIIVEPHDAIGLAFRHGPHEACAAVGNGQYREWTLRRETLVSDIVYGLLGQQVADDGPLPVVARLRRDTHHVAHR